MATLWITEYAFVATSGNVTMPVGQEPAVATQTVSFTTATQSAAFNASARLVRIQSSINAYVLFGSNPTATASTTPITANQPQWFGVVPGHKVSVYDGTS